MNDIRFLVGKSTVQLEQKIKIEAELKEIDLLIADTSDEIRAKIKIGLTLPLDLHIYTVRQRSVWKVKQTYMDIANEINASGSRIYGLIFSLSYNLEFPVDDEKDSKQIELIAR